MAEHNLFKGGRATSRLDHSMLPSVEQTPNGPMESAAHKVPTHFALSWGLAPSRGLPFTGERRGFLEQARYFECLEAPVAVGDIIHAVIMPRLTSLVDLWFANCKAIPGLTAEVRVRGNAASVGAPVVLGTIDFGVENPNGSLMNFAAINSGGQTNGVYFDQNDMLQIVITAVPASLDLSCIRFAMSPVIREYCRGDLIDCILKGDV